MRREHVYFVYILTNYSKIALYIGVTNNIEQRIIEHYLDRGKTASFTGRYHCYWLVYYEEFKYINDAIAREKQLKRWSRTKKAELIGSVNPNWNSLNDALIGKWPPLDRLHRRNLK